MDNPQFWLKISQGLDIDIDIEAAKNLIGISIWLSYIPFLNFAQEKKNQHQFSRVFYPCKPSD